ncbi:MAG: type II toxin-antitoxin system HicB family antitoxin [Candidatus Thorarchaeota archaeon]|nr:type II toxin-antitoxin system HicB family antitoxin [Candidatus Thorarchaeota archaeon]
MKKVRFTAIVWEEDGTYVSKCPEIDVSSAGDTLDEALSNLTEAIELWLVNARELGIMEDYESILFASEKSTQTIEINV